MTSLHGFWNRREARSRGPVVSRPDLVAQRNADTLGIEPYAASAGLEAHIDTIAPDHVACANAPSSWAALKSWDDNFGHNNPIPVFDGGCELTIYSEPKINHAFRAWHDRTHLRIDAGFDYDGEFAVALSHRASVRGAGLALSDAKAIMFDTIGQYRYYQTHNAYIHNQALFVAACFKVGIREACRYVW